MSGNFMFIVCEPCSKANEPDFGFKFAERGIIGCYEPFGPAKQTAQFATWLKKHQKCGGKGKPDHFLLAHLQPRNFDQPHRLTPIGDGPQCIVCGEPGLHQACINRSYDAEKH